MSAGNEIGDLLLDIGLITDEELASAHAEQTKTGERLTLVLERLGLITHHQLKDALELQFGVNFYSLSKSPPAKEIADLLSYETKNKYRVIPVTWAGTQFTIAMVNPDDLIALDAVRVELKSGHLKKVVCTADEFEFFMRDLYETPAEEAPTPATAASVAAPSAAEAAKPAAKVAAKGHLKSLFGDDDDDSDDDEDDVPVIPLPTVSPAAAALSAKLAPSLQDKDDDFDDDDDTDIPMPTVKAVRKFAPVGEAPDAVLQATPAVPAALPAPVVPAALDDEAPILNINTPTVNVVSQVSAALKQDQPASNGNGAVAEEAPAVAASTAALPPAFGLEAAKAFGLDDDDEDDDSDIPLPTVQPRKPAAAATPAPTPTPIPVVAPIVSPAAAPVVSAHVLSTQPAVTPVTPRKPAASVTAHTLPALNPDLLLSPMVSPAVAQKLLEEPKAEDIINSLVDSNAELHTAEPVKVTPFFQSDATAQSLASADYNIEDVVANVANNLVESIDTNVGYAPNASRQLLEEVVESELGGLEDNDINKLKEQQNSSIMLLAHEIIGKATQKRCSDIHLEPDASGVTLRYFLHGELLADCVLPGEIHQALVSSYKIIAGLNPNELRKPQDKKIVTDVEADRVELRITTLPSDHGEMVAISMRFLEK
jgi:hypothetical protein